MYMYMLFVMCIEPSVPTHPIKHMLRAHEAKQKSEEGVPIMWKEKAIMHTASDRGDLNISRNQQRNFVLYLTKKHPISKHCASSVSS